MVPYSVIGPFAGVFVDRWRREAILRWTPLVRAAAALLLLGGESAVPFYAGALLVLSGNRFFLVTAGTVTPKVVPPDDLLVANSHELRRRNRVDDPGGRDRRGGRRPDRVPDADRGVRGDVDGDVVRRGADPDRALGRPFEPVQPLLHRSASWRASCAMGRGCSRQTPRALAPITSYAVDQFLQGLILVMSFVVFKERFQEGVGSYSQLIAAGAVGGFLGLGTVGWLDSHLSRPRMVAAAFLVSGLPLIVISPFITGWTVLIASFFLGVGFAWKKVPIDTMVQTAVSDRIGGGCSPSTTSRRTWPACWPRCWPSWW